MATYRLGALPIPIPTTSPIPIMAPRSLMQPLSAATTTLRTQIAPSIMQARPAVVGTAEPVLNMREPPPEESPISPAMIAAGVAALGVIGFVAWKKLG
jgi:hypothetical protein